MARYGFWNRGWQGLDRGFQDPETGAAYIRGVETNRPLGFVNPGQADQWGGGYARNFMPDWKDPQGRTVNPDTGETFPTWNDYHRWLITPAAYRSRLEVQPTMPNQPEVSNDNGYGPARGPGGGSGSSAYPQDAYNMGGGAYPWLQPYEGQFTAPMSPYEQYALDQYGNFASGGAGTGPSAGYYGDVLGGRYLNFESNPWLQEIRSSGEQQKAYQDSDALRRIGSSMAAGGMALSGARAGAERDYLGQSNANFNRTMGDIFNQSYMSERALQDAAARGMLGVGQQQGQAWGNLMEMGAVPRNIEQTDYNRQYQDWVRQTNEYKDQFRYPDQLALQELHAGYPGSSNPQYGNSTADQLLPLLAMLLGGGGSGGKGGSGGILNQLLNSLLNGNNGQTGQQGGGTGGSYDPNSPYYNPYGNLTGYTGSQMYDQPIGPDLPPTDYSYDPGTDYSYPGYDPGEYGWGDWGGG